MSVWPVVMLKVAEPVLKSHMINVPPRSADSNMPATFMTCTGGVSGRCGRAVWAGGVAGCVGGRCGVHCTSAGAPCGVHGYGAHG